MSGDRLAFPWERDGWLHLYTIQMSGGEAKLLTPGDFEIQDLAPTPDRIGFVLSSNQGDPDRRHIWRVSQQLTKGDGIEWSPVPLADGRIAFLHSGSKMPARVAILEPDGSIRDLTPIPADFPIGIPGRPAAGNPDRQGRPEVPRPALPTARRRDGQTPGRSLFPRRLAPPDALRLALHAVLQPGIRI